jgi:hypothetical protein
MDAGLLSAIEAGLPALDSAAVFVYTYAGTVEEVRPVSSVSLTEDSVVLFNGETPLVSYPRLDVSFCSREPMQPFPP